MPDQPHQPIFVTGLPRSGTSLVAGLLHCCGAWTGNTVPGDAANPRGYFEHIIIRQRIIKPLLARLDGDPLGVSPLPPLDLSLTIRNLGQIIGSVLQQEGYAGASPWLYKDAKLTLVWPAFARAYPGATWVVVRRDRERIIDSCLRTSFMARHSTERSFWAAFVDQYEDRLATLADTVGAHAILDTDTLVAGDYSALRAVVTRCGLVFQPAPVEEFICSDFWHQ